MSSYIPFEPASLAVHAGPFGIGSACASNYDTFPASEITLSFYDFCNLQQARLTVVRESSPERILSATMSNLDRSWRVQGEVRLTGVRQGPASFLGSEPLRDTSSDPFWTAPSVGTQNATAESSCEASQSVYGSICVNAAFGLEYRVAVTHVQKRIPVPGCFLSEVIGLSLFKSSLSGAGISREALDVHRGTGRNTFELV